MAQPWANGSLVSGQGPAAVSQRFVGPVRHMTPCALRSHPSMTWRDILILAAISALLSAAITVCIRIVIENLMF
jgi:hypothetical protein